MVCYEETTITSWYWYCTDDDKGVTELATVIYDTPHVIKEHNDQSAISTQDNVAYGGTIPLKQNEAYEQVHIN